VPKLLLRFLIAVTCVCALAFRVSAAATTSTTTSTTQPSVVSVESLRDGRFRLLRDGQPYFIRGAGVTTAALETVSRFGGNSIRTWGVDDRLQAKLDEARRLGLTVCVGIWLGHERHGFDYSKPELLAAQTESVRKAVLRYKDHPAVLLWGIGNEMEGKGDNPAIWSHINSLAALVKSLDPYHPTMTVVAEIGGNRVQSIHRLCPQIDIIGINSYAGAASLPKRYAATGGKKPYILTELGPAGRWELRANSWSAVPEFTSTEKAMQYRRAYEATAADGRCL
jgi:exo-beta-1,3-glucanase (GH17 family)